MIKKEKIAFVLSGGGNRGALQVGALQVLLEAGLVPDMIVGASVGAINGALIAHEPTVHGARSLATVWRRVTRDDLYPGNHLTAVWSLLRGKEGLFSNERWQRFLSQHLPCKTFAGLPTECYIVATELNSGKLHVFGEEPDDLLIDSLMATCALPPLHPPYRIGERAYIDGGATANLPVRVALDKGATQIYALNIYPDLVTGQTRHLLDVSSHAIGALLQRQIDLDLQHCAEHKNVWLRHIDLPYPGVLDPWDFGHTDALIAAGRRAANEALLAGLRPPTWQERLTDGTQRLGASLTAATATLGNLLWTPAPSLASAEDKRR